jgi:hypothetical protein
LANFATNQRCGLFYSLNQPQPINKWSDRMIEIVATMAQIALVVIVAGTVCGSAVGLVAAEVANWWYSLEVGQ